MAKGSSAGAATRARQATIARGGRRVTARTAREARRGARQENSRAQRMASQARFLSGSMRRRLGQPAR